MVYSGYDIISSIWKISNADEFENICMDVFHFQYTYNAVYRRYCHSLHKNEDSVKTINDIPFLPIHLYKSHDIISSTFEPEIIFESSGTTESSVSRHLVKDTKIYDLSFTKTFEQFYGPAKQYCILGLLPSYLERGKSSLVYMVNRLMQQSQHQQNGFYLYEHAKLAEVIQRNIIEKIPTLLIGVTYALIDFALEYPMPLKNTIILETGGMKGRKKELLREEVHQILTAQWQLNTIHSEYGMTELLSQAYSKEKGIFTCPQWMMVLARQEDDPFNISQPNKMATGIANIIDLANVFSCSFIATDDIIKVHNGGTFEVIGRSDHSDLRGCTLMVPQQVV